MTNVNSYDCILKIAADSQLNIETVEGIPVLYCIKSNYFEYDSQNDTIVNLTRGATGNGNFYFFIPVKDKNAIISPRGLVLRLVGVISGNSYTLETVNHVPRIVSEWHMSAQRSVERVYSWNGNGFFLLDNDKK